MESQDENQPHKRALNSYARYTGIAFQMMAIIGIFTFAGVKLDEWLGLKYPVFTISLILLSVVVALYSIMRTLK